MSIENPSAFPMSADAQAAHPDFQGIILRDWFAGLALTGLAWRYDENTHYDDVARDAYVLADAMLLARKDAN